MRRDAARRLDVRHQQGSVERLDPCPAQGRPAISRIDEAEAMRVFQTLAELGELEGLAEVAPKGGGP